MRVKITLLAVALLLVAVPAAAQSSGTVELGGFYRYWLWGRETQLSDVSGFGGRIGYFFIPNLELEGAVGFSRSDLKLDSYALPGLSPNGKADVTPIWARLVYNYPATRSVSLMLGGGYTHLKYGGDVSAKDDAVGALAGIRIRASDLISLRLEGTVDLLERPFNRWYQNRVGDFGLQASVSLLLGGKPKDSDGDGVPDKVDRCPDTPKGVAVGPDGCRLDSDHDGVPDDSDQCPDTPAGTKVDSKGCPVDSDGDGVPDTVDKCPDTPMGVEVDAYGCPADSDRDGVPDFRDKCPDTPAGTEVDANGCPVDSDHDGVPDFRDKCPDTAPGIMVDVDGCPVKQALILDNVYFAFNKAELTPEAKAILDTNAAALKARPEAKVEVQGHTDNVGPEAVNANLSQARAKAVRDYLVARGVPAAQLTTKGYGPTRPIAGNGTGAGRAKNRRAELKVQ